MLMCGCTTAGLFMPAAQAQIYTPLFECKVNGHVPHAAGFSGALWTPQSFFGTSLTRSFLRGGRAGVQDHRMFLQWVGALIEK